MDTNFEEMALRRKGREVTRVGLELRIPTKRWSQNLVEDLWPDGQPPSGHLTDLEFRCKDGTVRAHRNFLKLFCPLLRGIFADRPDLLLDNEVVVVIKDFDVAVVEKFLEFVYNGQTSPADRSLISQVEDLAAKHFGIVEAPGKILVEESELEASPPVPRTESGKLKEATSLRPSTSSGSLSSYETASTPTKESRSPAFRASMAAKTPTLKTKEDSQIESLLGRSGLAFDNLSPDFDYGQISKRLASKSFELSSSAGSFSEHMDADIADKRCRYCETTFVKFNDLVGHFSKIHPGENPFGCTQCDKSFTRRYDLSIHILRVHEKAMLYRCNLCHKTFTNRHSRTRHVQIEHASFNESLIKAESHSSPGLSLDADLAKKIKKELPTPVERPPMETDDLGCDFECQKCQSSFETKDEVVSHYRERHQTSIHDVCEICKVVCANQKHYDLHIKLHDLNRRFACNVCDYRFPLRETLKRHILTVHEKVRPFGCDHCGKSFGVRGTLTTHMNLVHADILGSQNRGRKRKSNGGMASVKFEEDPLQIDEEYSGESESSVSVFRCFHCEDKFNSKGLLMRHIETFHLNDDQLDADTNFDEPLSSHVDVSERFNDFISA